MSDEHAPIGRGLVQLALALEEHIPGYVDAYFGPPEWKVQAKAKGARPLAELHRVAADLAAAIDGDSGLEPQRRDFLQRVVRAVQTSLRILDGARMPLAEEVEALYDIRPTWVDESVFEQAHRTLEGLLPPGGSLRERMEAHNKATEVPAGQEDQLLRYAVAELRRRTQQMFPLSVGESFELQMVTDQPWWAYNWYLGDFCSRIDVCTDLRLHVQHAAGLMAHEGYPGHHTEHCIKEARLLRERGQTEQCVTLLMSPGSVVSEGLANQALATLMTEEERIAWHAGQLFPLAGLGHLDAGREHQINEATRALDGAVGNAAFLWHDQGASQEQVQAYLRDYGLQTSQEAAKSFEFLANPLYRSYVFNYRCGEEMLERLFAARGERMSWFACLLAEPVTPSQIRAWTDG